MRQRTSYFLPANGSRLFEPLLRLFCRAEASDLTQPEFSPPPSASLFWNFRTVSRFFPVRSSCFFRSFFFFSEFLPRGLHLGTLFTFHNLRPPAPGHQISPFFPSIGAFLFSVTSSDFLFVCGTQPIQHTIFSPISPTLKGVRTDAHELGFWPSPFLLFLLSYLS